MKAFLLTLTLASYAVGSQAAVESSELKLRGCLSLVYSNAANSTSSSKEVIKSVSEGTKACRNEVKALKKSERAQKSQTKINEQIKKLQLKLSNLK